MRKKIFKKILPLLLGLAILLGPFLFGQKIASAANPTTINFQGKVVNSNGTNVADGNYSFVFRIYNTSSPTPTTPCTSDAACLWQETQASVSVTSGIFQVELGSSCALTSGSCNNSTGGPINFANNNALYLTMQFNGDTSGTHGGFMWPVIHINSVPFALQADNASTLGGLSSGNFVQLSPGSQQSGNINVGGNLQLQSATNVTTAYQFQNQVGSNALSIDTTSLNNLLVNSSFENSSTTNWVYSGAAGGSAIRSTSQSYLGGASLALTSGTTATANDGVKYTAGTNLTNSTTYTLSFYALQPTGTVAANMTVVYTPDGGTTNFTCMSGQTLSATAWTRYSCSFNSTQSSINPNASAFFIIKNGDATTRTFYLDAVQLEQASQANAYKETGINLQGTVTSNTIFSGLLTLQPAASLVAGQSELVQSFTNGSSTGGTVNGELKTITVNNTSSASTTNGINISLTDNTSLGNTSQGIKVTLSGSNLNQKQIGISSTVNSGVGIQASSTGIDGSSSTTCGSSSGGLSLGICSTASGSGGVGVYGASSSKTNSSTNNAGAGVVGENNAVSPGAGNFLSGVRGVTTINGSDSAYTTYGVYGSGKGTASATNYGGYFTLQSGSSTLGSALYASNSTVAANILDLQSNTTDVMVVGNIGQTTFQNSANSSTAFQIKNAAGAQNFNADTTNSITDATNNATNNLVTNGSFETGSTLGTTGWVKMGASQIAVAQDGTYHYIGLDSLKVVTTNADSSATDGAKYNLTTSTLVSNTNYTLTLSTRALAGTSLSSIFQLGYNNGSGGDISCSNNLTVVSGGWTTYSCNFTTGTTSGTPYIYAKINNASTNTYYIDGVQLFRTSLLSNQFADQSFAAGDWQAKSSATVTRDTTQNEAGAGTASVKTATSSGANNNDGVKHNITLNNSTQYRLDFWALLDSGSTAFTTMEAGYSSDGTTDNTVCITGQTVTTTWAEYTCLFTTPASNSGTPYIYVKELNTTGPKTYYIDNVSLSLGNSPLTGYVEGTISLNGTITSPINVQNQTDSNSAFVIQNVAGAAIMTGDTLNGQVTLGESSLLNGTLTFNNSANSNTVSIVSGSTSASYKIVLPTATATANNQCLVMSNTGSGATSWVACGASSTATVTLSPEYANAVMTHNNNSANGSTGTMTSDFCSGSSHLGIPASSNPCSATQDFNYYSWTANATNDYDIWTNWQAPSDFSSISSITFYAWTSSSSDAVKLTVYNAGTACGNSTINTASSGFSSTTVSTASCTGGSAISAGTNLTFDVDLKVGVNSEFARVSNIVIVYNRN